MDTRMQRVLRGDKLNMPVDKADKVRSAASYVMLSSSNSNNVSFGNCAAPVKPSSRAWLGVKEVGDWFAEADEIRSIIIQTVGTAVIAPVAILSSPGKNEEDKEKKKFQALRQPVSALLAAGFQTPVTVLIGFSLNNFAYEHGSKILQDEFLGTLIPSKDYIVRKYKNGIDKEGFEGIKTIQERLDSFETAIDGKKSLKEQLKESIKTSYSDLNIEIESDELERLANNVGRRKKFAKDKFKEEVRERFIDLKVDELLEKHPDGKGLFVDENGNIDVTKFVNGKDDDKLKEFIKHKYKAGYDALEKEANLSSVDKVMRCFGFETRNLKDLKAKQEAFVTKYGIEELKAKEPKLFDRTANIKEQMRKYITARDMTAQTLYKNKKFWIQLAINLGMTACSCYALNWAHPRFNEWLQKHIGKKQDKNQNIVTDNNEPRVIKARNAEKEVSLSDNRRIEVVA